LRGRRSSSGPFGVLPRASTPPAEDEFWRPFQFHLAREKPHLHGSALQRQPPSRGAPPTRENARAKYNLQAAARLRVRGNAAHPHEGSMIVPAALQIFDPPLAASWLVKSCLPWAVC